MGTWGLQAWENDEAADWFGELFSNTGLAERVEECLRLDISSNMAEIRAAAHIVSVLGRVHIWPLENLDTCLELAISCLADIQRRLERFASAEYRDYILAVKAEIDRLIELRNESEPS